MTVTLDISDDIAVIAIDDGGRNVINHEVLDALEPAWEQAEAGAKAIVLVGREGSFCAGYDIRVMTGADPKAAGRLGGRGGRLANRMFRSTVPTVAVATGHTMTIGAVWLACLDVRIGERGAFKYGMTEVALNVPYRDAWPLIPLRTRLTSRHLIPVILHSRIYDPEGALEAGFIDQLVDAGAGMDTALTLAADLAKLPGEAYRISKQTLLAEPLAAMAAEFER